MKKVPFSEADPFWKRPERVVLAVARTPAGAGNIIPLGWKMRTSFKPPVVTVSVRKTRYSHGLIAKEGEFVPGVFRGREQGGDRVTGKDAADTR